MFAYNVKVCPCPQYLDTPKLAAPSTEEATAATERVSARDRSAQREILYPVVIKMQIEIMKNRWARGKAILRGEIESQKSSGSQGSAAGPAHNNIAR